MGWVDRRRFWLPFVLGYAGAFVLSALSYCHAQDAGTGPAVDIAATAGEWATSMFGNMAGAIVAAGPWVLAVAAFVSGIFILASIFRAAAKGLSG